MHDDLPPLVRLAFRWSSFLMAGVGAITWSAGWVIVIYVGLLIASGTLHSENNEFLLVGTFLIGGLVIQLIGSAMCFFSQTLLASQPKKVPTDLLPRWWFARFMSPICTQLAGISLFGVLASLIKLELRLLLWVVAVWIGIRGYRYFRDQAIELGPPYPPRSGPPTWETRT